MVLDTHGARWRSPIEWSSGSSPGPLFALGHQRDEHLLPVRDPLLSIPGVPHADGLRVRDRVLASGGQLVVTAVSSTTKLVWREESSTPLNFTVTVEPAYEDRSKDFCAYPEALLRLE
jgi:hypothetical protein